MENIRDRMPSVPDELVDWDCNLDPLDSFDLGLDLDSEIPLPSSLPASNEGDRSHTAALPHEPLQQNKHRQGPAQTSAGDTPAPSAREQSSVSPPPALSIPNPPDSPFAPYSGAVPARPEPDRPEAGIPPGQHSSLLSSIQSPPQPPRLVSAPAPADKQDVAWQRFLSKLEDIKAKLDDFDEGTMEVVSLMHAHCIWMFQQQACLFYGGQHPNLAAAAHEWLGP